MNIQTESFFDFKTFRAYFFYLLFKRWPAKVMLLILVLSFLLFGAYLVANAIIYHTFDVEIFLLALLVLAINGSYFLISIGMAWRLYKKHEEVYLTPTLYQFEGKRFIVGLKGKNIRDGVKVEYSEVKRVEETKRFFYLFLKNGRAHVIRKDIFQHDVLELRELLQGFFAQAYRLKCK